MPNSRRFLDATSTDIADAFRVDLDSPEMEHIDPDLTEEERVEITEMATRRRAYGLWRGIERGHFYQLTADSIVFDNRPDFGLRTRQGLETFIYRLRETGTEDSRDTEMLVESVGHLTMYAREGWETGIYNEFRNLQGRGLTKVQILELVLYAHLAAGIRGLKQVYNAVGKHLIDWQDSPPPITRVGQPAAWPKGWAPDPAAFKAGLDLTVTPMTNQDRENIEAWYDHNVGFLPGSVSFAMTYHPEFYKWHRARWEMIFQTLPKQVLPYIMIREHMATGFTEGIREAVLLAKHWGVHKEWVVQAIMVNAYFGGFEQVGVVNQAVGDVMAEWDEPADE
ncbi:MAG TPA: hypothetical protein VNQ73_19820 [Ilumatobacter sp.]|nr:hypothetical protein [Ilumatobacter sp.]